MFKLMGGIYDKIWWNDYSNSCTRIKDKIFNDQVYEDKLEKVIHELRIFEWQKIFCSTENLKFGSTSLFVRINKSFMFWDEILWIKKGQALFSIINVCRLVEFLSKIQVHSQDFGILKGGMFLWKASFMLGMHLVSRVKQAWTRQVVLLKFNAL